MISVPARYLLAYSCIFSHTAGRSKTPTPLPKVQVLSTSQSGLLTPQHASSIRSPFHLPPEPSPLAPRHSLPQFSLNKVTKRHQPRISAPGDALGQQGEDIFESNFAVLEIMGKGAFSQVVKVKDRQTDTVYAIKKARGVFEGVKDRYGAAYEKNGICKALTRFL